MAAAWGNAALWFFWFGWWKDYLQSPTTAQRLDTHAQVADKFQFCTHMHTCQCNKNHADRCKNKTKSKPTHTHMPFKQTALLTWLSDGRPRASLQQAVTATPRLNGPWPLETHTASLHSGRSSVHRTTRSKLEGKPAVSPAPNKPIKRHV